MPPLTRQCFTDAETKLAMAEAPADNSWHYEDALDALDAHINEIVLALALSANEWQMRALLTRLSAQLPLISAQLQRETDATHYELERRVTPWTR